MQTARSDGRRRPSSDPNYRPTRPAAYWPLPPAQPLTVCGRCSAVIPATEQAERLHREHHAQVDAGDPQ